MKRFFKEYLYLIKRYHSQIIVQVSMIRIRNNQQFFVVAFQFLKDIFAEITGMCLFSVY